ncbi:MAG: 23S rRNA (guanosine(2251)-2'-O)-methyltransferase RlmB [Actinomycetota bacterium]|nr:23S rRNA (guanosine(2251)-2'-O)-methyltransferase RlmB [Actinomycetota bacterium]
MIVYGRNPVREAVRGRRAVLEGWVSSRAEGDVDWPDGVEVTTAHDDELDELAASPEHQGVCARVEPFPYADARALLTDDDALVVALDQVQDPHNLGAVARVAESAGAAGLVVPERRSADVTPAVCRASAGAVEHLAVARVRNLTDWLEEAKEAGAWTYGAAAGSDTPYTAPDYRGRIVVVLGSEGSGLRPRVAGACDRLVSLPRRGRVESLNVATAAAALVYGILQMRDTA